MSQRSVKETDIQADTHADERPEACAEAGRSGTLSYNLRKV
jgi:hypothetical protein